MSNKADQINLLNKDFYEIIADSFDSSRQFAWSGWEQLWQDYLQKNVQNKDFRVLDLGCGNARFYDFLSERLEENFGLDEKLETIGHKVTFSSRSKFKDGLNVDEKSLNKSKLEYFGIDYTKSLLDKAKAKNQPNCNLQVVDILSSNWSEKFETNQKFNLITLFGVMHHLYDQKSRLELFLSVTKLLSGQGKFVFTTWNFTDNYLASKITDLDLPETKKYLAKYNLDSGDFLENDYLLDWHRGKTSYRFAHNYTDLEIEDLVGKCGLKIEASFLADGKDGVSNKYWVTGK